MILIRISLTSCASAPLHKSANVYFSASAPLLVKAQVYVLGRPGVKKIKHVLCERSEPGSAEGAPNENDSHLQHRADFTTNLLRCQENI